MNKEKGLECPLLYRMEALMSMLKTQPSLIMDLHSWNVLKINDIWYHSDLCWASGFVYSKKYVFLYENQVYPYMYVYIEIHKHL